MTYRSGIATRERILEAVRELLAEGGLEATTVKAICNAAGILPGSFYNIFEAKEEAVLTVVREAIAAVEPEQGPDETVTDLIGAFVRFVTTDSVIARVYLIMAVSGGLTDPNLRRRYVRHHQTRVDRLARALKREQSGLSASEIQERAEALVAALTGYAIHAMFDPDFDMAKQAKLLVDH
ncbi:MAG: TetR/AcrR family transcriptional regulator [Actinobacteria bacterium]|nr:TetR/AcrR family transcriptional regulator [Acidimicrobiia bacterium]MCA1735033.1 TetR/AcrR family transcriptional regulator [Actinomycetota bacterium]MDQ3500075.1 TetR/AcrR family transcriptional regulator [Actinomycetota bacterium]